MKNQYIGDVGDYGKYGLLRFLSSHGISVGVNWYLTSNDGGPDGIHTEYLRDKRMREYDPELFDAMLRIADREDKGILMVEEVVGFDGVRFYDALLDTSHLYWRDRPTVRDAWHNGALDKLQNPDLIFADPDNGLSAVHQRKTRKNAEKFIIPSEVVDYYKRGQQVMYYHHRPRKNAESWLKDKRLMGEYLPDARLLAVTFRRWSSRTYIFVVHPEQYERYGQLVDEFLISPWGSHLVAGKAAFTTEEI